MPSSRPPWWVIAGAAAFLAYFGLLIYCDIYRPEAEGVSLVSSTTGLAIQTVAPASPADRAGIRPGDVITVADGRRVRTRADWEAIDANIRFDRPLALGVLRSAKATSVSLHLKAGPFSYWAGREGLELLMTRAAQLISLILGLVIVFRRPSDRVARLGGWLLCAIGVFCVVLPYRIADVWRGLPLLVGAALWVPRASTHLLPGLLLTFFVTFPTRRVRSAATLAAIWTPVVIVAGICLRRDLVMVYRPYADALPPDGLAWLGALSIGYLGATALAATANYRRLSDANERRRLRVLLLGAVVGALSAGPIFLTYWHSAELGLYASPVVGLAALMLLAFPLSFAYAILRHRLFDVRLIVRQGVRYALARRLLMSLVPILLGTLALDVYNHRNAAIAELFVARASIYIVLAGLALLAQFRRQYWLDALDRRFFRERYDAQRLLRRIAGEIRDSGSFERAAARVVVQIDLALHPHWVSMLARTPNDDAYRLIAGASPAKGPDSVPLDSKLCALTAVLGRPLDICATGTGWLADHLPTEEAARVTEWGLELLVPIGTSSDRAEALLALGPRRSGEPYAREDQDLLATIATSLAPVLAADRDAGTGAAAFGECPGCGACYDSPAAMCDRDGNELAAVRLPRVLAGRYRLDQRLGRGGMGVVYAATDLALEREVAVKVLREDLLGNPETASRFRLEARVSAGFAHPHVVRIYDFGIADKSRAFLVMERLTGATLREELSQRGPLDASRVLSIMRAICSAAEAAHRRGLVHRDLKPENVFLARGDGIESPKILDFGIAKVAPVGPGEGAASASVSETAADLLVGTPQYMAPEQLRGQDAGPAWDLWALGVMAYEMLTGSHPFAMLALGPTADAVPRTHTAVIARGTSAFAPKCEAFFMRALAIDPGRRPASATVFLSELEGALDGGDA